MKPNPLTIFAFCGIPSFIENSFSFGKLFINREEVPHNINEVMFNVAPLQGSKLQYQESQLYSIEIIFIDKHKLLQSPDQIMVEVLWKNLNIQISFEFIKGKYIYLFPFINYQSDISVLIGFSDLKLNN